MTNELRISDSWDCVVHPASPLDLLSDPDCPAVDYFQLVTGVAREDWPNVILEREQMPSAPVTRSGLGAWSSVSEWLRARYRALRQLAIWPGAAADSL